MATRKIKDAKDLSTQELIYFKGHAKATFMSDGSSVEESVKRVESATVKNKGYFKTLADLQTAYPNGGVGSKAYVGVSSPYAVYLWENGAWVDSGTTSGDESVDLGGYYTKDEVDAKVTELSEELGKYENIEGYIRVILDAEEKFLFGIKEDGCVEWAKGVPAPIKSYILENCTSKEEMADLMQRVAEVSEIAGKYISDDMYILACVDAEDKVLYGVRRDGCFEWAKGIPTPIKERLDELENNGVVNIIEDSDDNVEMILDAEDRIVAYRNKQGEKVENVGIKTKRLSFIGDGFSEFVKDLKAEGFGGGKSDLSDESHIAIPLPTSLVKVNITAPQFPTSKVDEIKGYIEFADRNGNYFKKPIEALALQGSTSLGAPKKNLKFDFSDCTMKVGNWVTQDSFHLKSNYYDVFRGKSNLAYDLWRKIIEYNRPKTFRTPYINASEYSWYEGVNDMGNDFNEARLTPAGFPVELYFNGEYIGIYTWNIKKDRANYAMDKKKSNNIHIDPSDIGTLIAGESIIWENFEIRNPKSLVTMDGAEYDGDAPLELIDSSSAAYNSSNSDHKRSAEVKASIIAFKDACAEVIAKKDKATFEQYFDKDWFIDFNIWGNVVLDGDGLARNTQYLYWGGKWYPAPYDCDQIYGNIWRGNYICRKYWMRVVNVSILGQYAGIYDTFLTLYADDIEQRYKELRDADVISANSVISQIAQYVDHIGKDAYEREFELWNETPSYREPNDNPQWHFEGDYYEGTPSEWNGAKSYKVGDYVSMFIEGDTYYWKCVQNNTGVRPYYDKYGENPMVGGYFDSLTRTEKWLNVRFEFLDNHFNR